MIENKKHPTGNQLDQPGENQEEVNLSIGNSPVTNTPVDSEFYPEEANEDKNSDRNKAREESDKEVIPSPEEIYPSPKSPHSVPPPNIENADEDKLNPFPDELRPELNKGLNDMEEPPEK